MGLVELQSHPESYTMKLFNSRFVHCRFRKYYSEIECFSHRQYVQHFLTQYKTKSVINVVGSNNITIIKVYINYDNRT